MVGEKDLRRPPSSLETSRLVRVHQGGHTHRKGLFGGRRCHPGANPVLRKTIEASHVISFSDASRGDWHPVSTTE